MFKLGDNECALRVETGSKNPRAATIRRRVTLLLQKRGSFTNPNRVGCVSLDGVCHKMIALNWLFAFIAFLGKEYFQFI